MRRHRQSTIIIMRLLRLAHFTTVAASTITTPPTTLLGGFLGAGKTTALTSMLKNRDGLKIAVLVNDVNVDAQVLRRSTIDDKGVEMVELVNGCVCCGPGAGGLAPAVHDLATRVDAATGAPAFDHVVVELSGVADPTNVQRNLNGAVDRKVALVDANAFPMLYNSVAEMGDRVDLAGADQLDIDPCSVDRRVVELLLTQIETADVILVNKADLASEEELRTTLAACKALNEEAKICTTTFGNAALAELLPLEEPAADDEAQGSCCGDPSCPSNSQQASNDHSHEHSHSHSHSSGCGDPTCTDPTHNHDENSHAAVHNHEHSHAAASLEPNSVASIGFTTYVYRARRPFIQERLVRLVQQWPLPSKEMLTTETLARPGGETLVQMQAAGKGNEGSETFARVLRSKGTCWLDQQHRVMASWSHAGRHFRLTPEGTWWATLPDKIVRACLSDDGADTEADTAAYRTEKAHFEGEYGDRRQEIVFIGVGIDEEVIAKALDSCLATDEEMRMYKALWSVDEERIKDSNGEVEPFRFDVGTRVECAMGFDEWLPGKVVQQFYRRPQWPQDRWAPYKIELDNGETISSPADSEACIRREKL